MNIPATVGDLAPCPENPREIGPDERAALRLSMEEYGDLSGIVFNKQTGWLITGHQRSDLLRTQHGNITISDVVPVETKHGPEMVGHILDPQTGEQFSVRIVDWPHDKARAAMVIANSYYTGGQFTDKLGKVLDDVGKTIDKAKGRILQIDRLRLHVPSVISDVDESGVPAPSEDEDIKSDGDFTSISLVFPRDKRKVILNWLKDVVGTEAKDPLDRGNALLSHIHDEYPNIEHIE